MSLASETESVKTGYRNPVAFCLALGAAYSASFALDMFFGALLGVYTFSPLSVPIFTWGVMAIALHFVARMVAVSVNWTRNPYLLLGALAAIAGVFGTHRHSLLVGVPLLLIGLAGRAPSKPAPSACPACPKCGSANVLPILYGLPDRDGSYENVYLAGCVFKGKAFHCMTCEHEFGEFGEEPRAKGSVQAIYHPGRDT